jgi:hypothetical protein
MKILIKVTKEVLKRSAKCGYTHSDNVGSNCAVALAVNELLPNAWVSRASIQLFDSKPTHGSTQVDDAYAIIIMPEVAREFVNKFDLSDYHQRRAMPELHFEVELPESVIHRIGISEAYRILSESKTLELVGEFKNP